MWPTEDSGNGAETQDVSPRKREIHKADRKVGTLLRERERLAVHLPVCTSRTGVIFVFYVLLQTVSTL